jgi:hypothetical protein
MEYNSHFKSRSNQTLLDFSNTSCHKRNLYGVEHKPYNCKEFYLKHFVWCVFNKTRRKIVIKYNLYSAEYSSICSNRNSKVC